MKLELKDIVLIGIAFIGWLWAVIQFFLSRRNQKRDKALEKRFEVYSAFMNKMDEISQSMRSDPKALYGFSNEFYSKLLNGDEEQMHQALLDFNTELIEYTKRSVQPLMILNQELNKLRLVCSDNLLPKIEEYKMLANDFNDDFQSVLKNISMSSDLSITGEQLNTVVHNSRTKQMDQLWKSIEILMRKEIGYYSQK